jgi:3-oxoacyl-[acyl-carrier-protein] synthase-3
LGTGACLPGEAITTEVLLRRASELGINNTRMASVIAKRLGIRERYACREMRERKEIPRAGQTNPDLCAKALREALGEAQLEAPALGYIIGHTTTPSTLLPPNIAWVADLLEYPGPYAELRQACTGFANAIQLGVGMLTDPDSPPIGIVGSETGSVFCDPRHVDEHDDHLVNLVQMSDGAGAAILAADNSEPACRIEAPYFGTAGLGKPPGIALLSGGSGHPFCERADSIHEFVHFPDRVKDHGPQLFASGISAIRGAGYDIDRFNWVLPHQANARIGEVLGEELGIPAQKFIVDADLVGNLGSASIWVALHRLRASGKLADGDSVLVLGAEATKFFYGGFIYRHHAA